MSINKTIGRGEKGSRFWIQQLVNSNSEYLNNELVKIDPSIGNITWISPLVADDYLELKTEDISDMAEKYDIKFKIPDSILSFWPPNGPYWDAVGIDDNNTLLLVECKAHRAETRSACRSISNKSKLKMREAMKKTCFNITNTSIFPENVWFNEYFQLANKLSFLYHLNKAGIKTKLILLNILDDPTFIRTTLEEWNRHYQIIFNKMFEKDIVPDNVLILNLKINNKVKLK